MNRVANAYHSVYMAVRNIIGFAMGSYTSWYSILPSILTLACSEIVPISSQPYWFIVIPPYISIRASQEIPYISRVGATTISQGSEQSSHTEEPFLEQFAFFKNLPGSVWLILYVTALTWIGFILFLLFDADWMGREVYGVTQRSACDSFCGEQGKFVCLWCSGVLPKGDIIAAPIIFTVLGMQLVIINFCCRAIDGCAKSCNCDSPGDQSLGSEPLSPVHIGTASI